MRKWRTALCLLVVLALVPAALQLRRRLPLDTQPLIEARYGGWAGVLRLWICDDPSIGGGSLPSWLNECVSAFEKAHAGVYVQPEYVSAADLAAIGKDGLPLPDLVLFPTYSAPDASALLPLDVPSNLRGSLAALGWIDGQRLVVPVLLGGYSWAINTDRIAVPPDTWRGSGLTVAAAEPDPRHDRGAALLALCSSTYSEAVEDPSATGAPRGEIELGLPDANPEPTPAPTDAPEVGSLYCALPEDFAWTPDAFQVFARGEADALLVTPVEVCRLESLAARGAGPTWSLATSGEGAFTDQVMYAGIVRRETDDAAADTARRGLCASFIAHLLSDASQQALFRAGAFSVTDALSGYAAGDALAELEAFLRSTPLFTPDCFDVGWREASDVIVREFLADARPSAILWRELASRLE